MTAEQQSSGDLIEQLIAALRPLPKEVAQSFLENLDALFSSSVIEFTDSGLETAPGTRRGTLSLRLVGVEKFIAAARSANQLDV